MKELKVKSKNELDMDIDHSNMKIKIENNNNINEISSNNLTKKEKIKITISIIYYILVIGIEFSYRDKLFEKSLKIEENIQENYDKNSLFVKFWKLISEFGTAKITMFTWFIIFITYPINYSFQYLQSIIYTNYITNLFKMFYRNHRPYWHSDKIIFSCNSGYGNPSGHSMTSTCVYLSLSHILTDFNVFKKKYFFLKIIIFSLFSILIIMIISSRIILGAHSLNQVIYGFLLGFGNYFVIFFLLKFHKYSPLEFLNFFLSKSNNILLFAFHFILLIICIITYFSIKDNNVGEINEKIFNGIRCKIKKEYSKYKNDGLYQSLSITSLLGAHLGILILIFLTKKKYINVNENLIKWNKVAFKHWLFRLPILLISGIGIILYFIISGKANLVIIFIFKSAIPFFLSPLGLYSLGIYYSMYLNLSYPLNGITENNINNDSSIKNPV